MESLQKKECMSWLHWEIEDIENVKSNTSNVFMNANNMIAQVKLA
jgi:hypothetical protein